MYDTMKMIDYSSEYSTDEINLSKNAVAPNFLPILSHVLHF